MYQYLLPLHNILRWALLLAGLYAITKAALGVIHKRSFTANENRSQVIFLVLSHSQLLLGLILYFISPYVSSAMEGGMGALMKNAESRFIVVEHSLTMIVAIMLIQVGRSLSKKQKDDMAKHKKALLFFSIAFVLMLSRIPWQRAMWPF